jgi:NAD(P)-dependent dehydrogenase (short-subunit alcohol dehydrogenase family)
MHKLLDRTAVVTGAGSGIGRAIALLLARRGCRVALVDVNVDGLAETDAKIKDRGGVSSTHVVDVANREQMLALPEAVLAAHGGVHILVNNAGVTTTAAFHEHTLDDFDWVMGVNLWGVVHGCHAFMPHLLRADEAHIVNISSIFGVVGIPGQSSYCASKFAVRGFTESLWEELDGTHVGVSCVHPGGVSTGIASAARMADESQREGLVAFFRDKAIPASTAAAQIVDGILKSKRRILITREAHALDLLKRVFPDWGNRWGVAALVKVIGMQGTVEEQQAAALAGARKG